MVRETVEYVMLQDVAPGPLAPFGLPLGWLGTRFGHDDETKAASFLVEVKAHWIQPESTHFTSMTEMLVLSGEIRLADQTLRAGHYARIPAGVAVSPARSDTGCTFLLMSDGSPAMAPHGRAAPDAADAIEVIDVNTVPWLKAPDFEGRTAKETPPGVFVKWLREEPDNGPYTLITRQMPGWSDPLLEAHHCWEELVLLEGDYLMGLNGEIKAGCYIFRNGEIPHGPQASRNGSIWFCRGNTRIDFQYSKAEWAMGQIDRYLNAEDDTDAAALSPWGDWRLPHAETKTP